MPSPTMYWQADAMHLFICGHAPYHHGILSADPVSLPTAGLFNCKRAFFTHLLYNHSAKEAYSTVKYKLPYSFSNITSFGFYNHLLGLYRSPLQPLLTLGIVFDKIYLLRMVGAKNDPNDMQLI